MDSESSGLWYSVIAIFVTFIWRGSRYRKNGWTRDLESHRFSAKLIYLAVPSTVTHTSELKGDILVLATIRTAVQDVVQTVHLIRYEESVTGWTM
jgi:hypothetical protein